MLRMTTLVALASLVFVSTAVAQNALQQRDVVEPNPHPRAGTTANFAPAPAPAPAAQVTVACKLISVSVPAMPKDKPATYHVLVKDNVAGLMDELKTCNPTSDLVAFKVNSAAIKVTQANGQAYFKVPTGRAGRLMLSFSTSQANWTADRFWDSAGPIGERTEVTLVVAQAGEQSK